MDARNEHLTINGSSRTPLGCESTAPRIEWTLKLHNDHPNTVWDGVLLAMMCAGGIAAYLLIDTKTVLQRNPCTIAGVAILLVDSATCNGQLADGIP